MMLLLNAGKVLFLKVAELVPRHPSRQGKRPGQTVKGAEPSTVASSSKSSAAAAAASSSAASTASSKSGKGKKKRKYHFCDVDPIIKAQPVEVAVASMP